MALPTLGGEKRVGVLLPGNHADIETSAFAVSRGTSVPEKAYALANFLSTQANIALYTKSTPARKSLSSASDSSVPLNVTLPKEVQQLITDGFEKGFSANELRYAGYLVPALDRMKADNIDAQTALQTVEDQAIKSLQAAVAKKSASVAEVATPIPSLNLPDGKVALRFGLGLPGNRLLDAWNQLGADFAQNDPQVGRVDLVTTSASRKIAEETDCFYLPYNYVPSVSLDLLLNLDPFLTADADYNASDMYEGILPQLQRNDKTWALPATLNPFDPDVQPGHPESCRLSRAFCSVDDRPLSGCAEYAEADQCGRIFRDINDERCRLANAHCSLWRAAAGFSHEPNDYQLHFCRKHPGYTSGPLISAKNGLVRYQTLGTVPQTSAETSTALAPVHAALLSNFLAQSLNSSTASHTLKLMPYPVGNRYKAVAASIGTLYISKRAAHPEGCYRWIKAITRHPELFHGLPAYRSQLSAGNLSPAVQATYEYLISLLKSPDTVTIPVPLSDGASLTGTLLQYWLYQAMDRYMLDNVDLEAALQDAEAKASGFQTCTANLDTLTIADALEQKEALKAFRDCAVKFDASLSPLLDTLLSSSGN